MSPIHTPREWRRVELFAEQLLAETDRGVVLSSASLLETCLGELIGAFLSDSPESRRLLDGPSGGLSTFSARIDAAFALGLIQEDELHDLQIVRRIRNRFAHTWEAGTLDDPELSPLCRDLPSFDDPQLCQVPARRHFIEAVLMMLSDFAGRGKHVKRERRRKRRWTKHRGVWADMALERAERSRKPA